jgi:hypothetical protein
MPQYPSKERVERDGVLVYAEGDPIPDTDTAELARQGYVKSEPKAKAATADKARKPAKNK